MVTQVLAASDEALALSSKLLSEGQLVAFPTETVYGLGANALDPQAVKSIFEAKGRPQDNPLIVHIWHRDQLEKLCFSSPMAEKLMDAFWPGPLTILMPKKPSLPMEVTAGLDTVGVRMPSHPVALKMLQACNLPIAAPSANRSGKPSPTTAEHVRVDMEGRIPLILDGSSSEVGVESTVLDISGDKPCILRPGGVTKGMLEEVLGISVDVAGSVLRPLQAGEQARSPGMRYRHYSPDGQVSLVQGEENSVVAALQKLYDHASGAGHHACVMCFTEHVEALKMCNPHDIGSIFAPEQVAHRLFDTLRALDDEKMSVIFSQVVPPEELGLAVMNRLGRAAAFRMIQAEDVLKDE